MHVNPKKSGGREKWIPLKSKTRSLRLKPTAVSRHRQLDSPQIKNLFNEYLFTKIGIRECIIILVLALAYLLLLWRV